MRIEKRQNSKPLQSGKYGSPMTKTSPTSSIFVIVSWMKTITIQQHYMMPTTSCSGMLIQMTWILLDSQSIVNVFCNCNLLQNVHQVLKQMQIPCNAGIQSTNLVRELSAYGDIWYDLKEIANILSPRNMKRKYDIAYNSQSFNSESPLMGYTTCIPKWTMEQEWEPP